MTDGREQPQAATGDLVDKTKNALKSAADWAADRLEEVSARLEGAGADDAEVEQPTAAEDTPAVARTPPAPVTGDAGARAAGSVKDDITDTELAD